MCLLEGDDFFIGPAGMGGFGRAKDDQTSRGGERLADGGAKVARGGELVPVAEDRAGAGRDGASRRLLADQRARHAVFFQRFMQPVGGGAVAVAVAEESPITRDAV